MSISTALESHIAELQRQVDYLTATGMITLDVRRFIDKPNSPLVSEAVALLNKVNTANKKYDLDSLPLLENDVEEAKAKARDARSTLKAYHAKENDLLIKHDRETKNYHAAVNRVGALRSIKLDKFASKAEHERHNKDIAKAQAEVDKAEGALSTHYIERTEYYRELKKLSDAYDTAASAVAHAEKLLSVVRSRLGMETETKPEANALGFTS